MFSPKSDRTEKEQAQIDALLAHQDQVRVQEDAQTRVTRHSQALAKAEQDELVHTRRRTATKDALVKTLADA